ncbi:MAG: amidohydrolase [Gammaproteobacteria bacterium]|nr:MAG: amidohydrolase [Gammaproteobacteria bacterium]
MRIKLSVIQLNTKTSVEQNLQTIAKYLAKLTQVSANENSEHIVVLPECCLFFGANDKAQLLLANNTRLQQATNHSQVSQSQVNSELQVALGNLAKKYKVTLIAGTIPLLTDDHEKFTNSSCAFSANGELIGRYDKIHLFDVNVASVKGKEKNYYESRFTQAGKSACLVKTPVANIGLTVCFDLRFPILYQQLTALGADIITVPSAFTRVTGKAHWQTLLQARAIENQVYIIAAGQEGVHENGRETWGHSMIISPWGEILACLEQGEGIISSDFIPAEITKIRASMPLKHAFNNQLTIN